MGLSEVGLHMGRVFLKAQEALLGNWRVKRHLPRIEEVGRNELCRSVKSEMPSRQRLGGERRGH